MTAEKRWIYYIDPSQDPGDDGYVPSIVAEDEPGHAPLKGNGELAQPWYWGKTRADAEARASDENAKRGIDPDEALSILMSSMRA